MLIGNACGKKARLLWLPPLFQHRNARCPWLRISTGRGTRIATASSGTAQAALWKGDREAYSPASRPQRHEILFQKFPKPSTVCRVSTSKTETESQSATGIELFERGGDSSLPSSSTDGCLRSVSRCLLRLMIKRISQSLLTRVDAVTADLFS